MTPLFHGHSVASACTWKTFSRFYSVAANVTQISRKKWGVSGVPPPRSILDDDDTSIDLSEDNDLVNGSRTNMPLHLRRPPTKPTPQEYKTHREVMKKDFPDGWAPPRKLSREAMEGIRQMHRLNPSQFTTPVLAEKFKISPEAVRRILKSKWEPPREKRLKIAERERREKAEYVRSNRLRERTEARQVAESSRGDDRLTFE